MASPFTPEDLDKLKKFFEFVSANPLILNIPQMAFVKQFIEKFGGKVPAGEFPMPGSGKCPFGGDAKAESESPEVEEESEESEVELDMEGVIEPDKDIDQPMGDSSKTPSEEDINKSSELRSQAASAYSDGAFQEAINLYTQAIEINPGNALFHAKRGQAFLKLKKPNACIRDCNKALEINCDSAAAYKFRGRANRLLGNWEDAAKDLRQACKLDYDEEADEWLREVTPNAKKIEQHRLKQQRKQADRERKAAEEARPHKARQEQTTSGTSFKNVGNLGSFLTDMCDPEVVAAFEDIIKNPANVKKYRDDPKFSKLIESFKCYFKNGAPDFSAFTGGFPGAADADGAGNDDPLHKDEEPKAEPKKPDFTDDALD